MRRLRRSLPPEGNGISAATVWNILRKAGLETTAEEGWVDKMGVGLMKLGLFCSTRKFSRFANVEAGERFNPVRGWIFPSNHLSQQPNQQPATSHLIDLDAQPRNK